MSKREPNAAILEKLNSVNHYATVDAVWPIPHLIKIDRKAYGWLRIVFFGSMRFLRVSFVLFVASIIFTAWLNAALQLIHEFLSAITRGMESIILLAMVLISGWIIYRAESWGSIVENKMFWHDEHAETRLLQLILKGYALVVQLMIAMIVGSFLLYSLLPFTMVALGSLEQVQPVFSNWRESWSFLRTFWVPSLAFLAVIIISILLLRKSSRERLIKLNLTVLGGFGLLLILETLNSRLEPSWLQLTGMWFFSERIFETEPVTLLEWVKFVYVIFTAITWEWVSSIVNSNRNIALFIFWGMALAYPTGIAFSLAKPFQKLYSSFYKAFIWTVLRARLRWRTESTLKSHWRRNQQNIRRDGWASVCKNHLIRFVSTKETRSYGRRFVYYSCPSCKKDNDVYTGVHCIAMNLDVDMRGDCVQIGPSLLLNGFKWMHNQEKLEMPLFDAIIISKTNQYDIDEFFATYMNKEKNMYAKSLNRVIGQVMSGTELEENERNMLENHLSHVSYNYNPQLSPDACFGKVRRSDSIYRQKQRLFQGTKRVSRMAFRLIVAGIITVLFVLFVILPALQ